MQVTGYIILEVLILLLIITLHFVIKKGIVKLFNGRILIREYSHGVKGFFASIFASDKLLNGRRDIKNGTVLVKRLRVLRWILVIFSILLFIRIATFIMT